MSFVAISYLGYVVLSRVFNVATFEQQTAKAMSRSLSSAYIYVSQEYLIFITIVFSSLLFLGGFFMAGNNLIAGLTLGFVMAMLGFYMPHVIISRLVEKHRLRLNEELPSALEILSSSLKAGLTLQQAIERNIERLPITISQEFKIVIYECRFGKSLNEALTNFAERTGLMDAKLVAIASELSLRHGGNLSRNYQSLSRQIRDRYMFQKEVSALTAEGRMQAIVMTILPFVILLIMTLLRRKEMMEFLSSPLGIASVLTVSVMQIIAYIWINNVVTIDV